MRTPADTTRKHTERWITYHPVQFTEHAVLARQTLDAMLAVLIPRNCPLCCGRVHLGPCEEGRPQ